MQRRGKAVRVRFSKLKDDNVRVATGFVVATTKLVRVATCFVRPAT